MRNIDQVLITSTPVKSAKSSHVNNIYAEVKLKALATIWNFRIVHRAGSK